MAKYTIELRRICDIYTRPIVEQWFKSYNIEDYLLPSQIEQLNKYNIWSKDKLAKLIVDHFYMREIGFETPALFKHYAIVTMEEIMQEKLPLIYTLALDYNPLINVDYTETFERSANQNQKINGNINNTTTAHGKGTSQSTANNDTSGLNINNDTPQGNITKQNLDTGTYASSVNQSDTNSSSEQNTNTTNDNTVTDENTSTQNSTNDTLENYTRNWKGNQGISATYQAMIKQFRENIVSINKDIINELQTLFMGLY